MLPREAGWDRTWEIPRLSDLFADGSYFWALGHYFFLMQVHRCYFIMIMIEIELLFQCSSV